MSKPFLPRPLVSSPQSLYVPCLVTYTQRAFWPSLIFSHTIPSLFLLPPPPIHTVFLKQALRGTEGRTKKTGHPEGTSWKGRVEEKGSPAEPH